VQPQLAPPPAVSLPRPDRVIVFNFAVTPGEVTENQGFIQGVANRFSSTSEFQREQDIGSQAANSFAEELVKRINNMGLPVERGQRGMPLPANALLISGQFLDVNEGNRLARTVVGFGLGASTMDTQVQVYAPSNTGYRMVLEFKTHADSGEMPGVAVTGPAGAAAAGGLTAGVAAANMAVSGAKGYMSSVGPMASRSANQAADYLSQFFAQNGWISSNQSTQPNMGN
jgi:membrane protease subunit (stomatin/prohibitin family)